MKRVLIFGSNSNLAKKIKLLIDKKKYVLILYSKKKIDFLKKNNSKMVSKILSKENPDVILNFAGVIGTNNDNYTDVYNVNFAQLGNY